MMDHTALNGTTSTTTIIKNQEEWKKKKGFGPLIILTVLLLGCAFYAGEIRGSSSLAGSGGGTTRGATTAASLTMMSNATELKYDPHPTCVKSAGTYDSQKDYCYTCGGGDTGETLGYCWNSQTPQCPPDCKNPKGVSGIGNGNCGDSCNGFLNYQAARTRELCTAMGYIWKAQGYGSTQMYCSDR